MRRIPLFPRFNAVLRSLQRPNRRLFQARFWGPLVCVALVCVMGFSAPTKAQESPQDTALDWSLDPVFEQNGVDGLLLGASGDLVVAGFRPFAALGYGLDSGGLRYRAGLGWQDWSASLYDWADAPVLGRTGESGMALKAHMTHSQASLRVAQLWPLEEESQAPQVVYFHNNSSFTFNGDFELSLTVSGTLTVGVLAQGDAFESSTHTLRGRWGDVRFSFSEGTSSNEAELPGFEFTQGMRGYDTPLKGHSFWRGRLERRVPLLRVPLDLKPLLKEVPVPNLDLDALAFVVEASGFGEVLQVAPNPSPVDDTGEAPTPESRLGWGLGLVLSLKGIDFELRFDLFFNQTGEMKPLFG